MYRSAYWRVAAGVLLITAIVGCGGEEREASQAEVVDQESASPTEGGGLVNVGGRLFSIPSPMQTAMLIKRTGAAYDRSIMLDPATAEGLTTRQGKAFAMGVYGCDLGYSIVHQDAKTSLQLMLVIEQLSKQLDMGNAIDRMLVERFRSNASTPDSLMRLSGEAFRSADQYLKSNERSDVAALILAGGWVASLHYAATHAKGGTDQDVAVRIGEQRRVLNDLIDLLESTDEAGTAKELVADLRTLRGTFEDVRTTYAYEPAVTDEKSRTTFINSRTTITITPAQLADITRQAGLLRTKHLN